MIRTRWWWFPILLLPLKLQILLLLWVKSSLTFRQSIECRFTLKLVRYMIVRYSQMHGTDKYSQHSSIIGLVALMCWVFVYELSGRGIESRCCHLNFIYGACLEQGVPWYSRKLWSQSRMWHDNKIQSNTPYR